MQDGTYASLCIVCVQGRPNTLPEDYANAFREAFPNITARPHIFYISQRSVRVEKGWLPAICNAARMSCTLSVVLALCDGVLHATCAPFFSSRRA